MYIRVLRFANKIEQFLNERGHTYSKEVQPVANPDPLISAILGASHQIAVTLFGIPFFTEADVTLMCAYIAGQTPPDRKILAGPLAKQLTAEEVYESLKCYENNPDKKEPTEERGPRTDCPACGGSGCEICIPDEFKTEA